MRTMIEKLEGILEATKKELTSFESGKKASAPVIRKLAQESKTVWQDLRVEVMKKLKEMPTRTRKTDGATEG